VTRPPLYSTELNIRISEELLEKLKKISKEKGITASEMVRRLILNYLDKLEKEEELEKKDN
jgi:predicted DNA-binding protein